MLFRKKSQNLCALNFDVFHVLTFDLFLSSVEYYLLKEKETPLLKSESAKTTKNVIDFWFRKWNLIIEFSI